MTTTQLEYWRTTRAQDARDQHPGCHTGASGFDYVAIVNPADKTIDEFWANELRRARQPLVQLLQNKLGRRIHII